MKIALFVPSWPPGASANGIVTYASQLIPALRRLGHEVFVLVAHKSADDKDPYTIDLRKFGSTTNIWTRILFRLVPEYTSFLTATSALVCAIRELVKLHRLDVFEMEESFGWSFEVSRLKLLPVIVRLHGPWFLNGRYNDPGENAALNRHRIKLECRGIQHADFVSAPSGVVLRAVKDHYNLSLEASGVIPNPMNAAIESETWNPKNCKSDYLLYVGRFDRLKGGDFVLRAFAKLATSYPQLRLTFVGPDRGIIGSDGKIQSFEYFVRSNLSEECRSRIEFCGQLSQSDVMSLRAKSFCTIIASQHENMPYSVLEVMSLGCPMIATAVGGIPELIKDRRNGLLVPSQDVKAMVSACKTLLDDQALAARLGRQAWWDCCGFYGPENVAKQTVAAYNEAIEKFKSRNTDDRSPRT